MIILLVTLFLCNIVLLDAGGTFILKFVRFHDSAYVDHAVNCCRFASYNSTQCSRYLDICIGKLSNPRDCIFEETRIEVKICGDNKSSDSKYNIFPNQMFIKFYKWTRLLSISIKVYKDDIPISNGVLMEDLSYNLTRMAPSPNRGIRKQKPGTIIGKRVTLNVESTIYCDNNYYGDCTIYCRPIPFLYFCDMSGSKVCVEGTQCETKSLLSAKTKEGDLLSLLQSNDQQLQFHLSNLENPESRMNFSLAKISVGALMSDGGNETNQISSLAPSVPEKLGNFSSGDVTQTSHISKSIFDWETIIDKLTDSTDEYNTPTFVHNGEKTTQETLITVEEPTDAKQSFGVQSEGFTTGTTDYLTRDESLSPYTSVKEISAKDNSEVYPMGFTHSESFKSNTVELAETTQNQEESMDTTPAFNKVDFTTRTKEISSVETEYSTDKQPIDADNHRIKQIARATGYMDIHTALISGKYEKTEDMKHIGQQSTQSMNEETDGSVLTNDYKTSSDDLHLRTDSIYTESELMGNTYPNSIGFTSKTESTNNIMRTSTEELTSTATNSIIALDTSSNDLNVHSTPIDFTRVTNLAGTLSNSFDVSSPTPTSEEVAISYAGKSTKGNTNTPKTSQGFISSDYRTQDILKSTTLNLQIVSRTVDKTNKPISHGINGGKHSETQLTYSSTLSYGKVTTDLNTQSDYTGMTKAEVMTHLYGTDSSNKKRTQNIIDMVSSVTPEVTTLPSPSVPIKYPPACSFTVLSAGSGEEKAVKLRVTGLKGLSKVSDIKERITDILDENRIKQKMENINVIWENSNSTGIISVTIANFSYSVDNQTLDIIGKNLCNKETDIQRQPLSSPDETSGIIGGVVTALYLSVLFIVAFFLIRRKYKERNKVHNSTDLQEHGDSDITEIIASGTNTRNSTKHSFATTADVNIVTMTTSPNTEHNQHLSSDV